MCGVTFRRTIQLSETVVWLCGGGTSFRSTNKMTEANEYGSDSTEDSNDMLWETIKVDLALNRACQSEQLQSLKGSSVKLSPSKRKVRKHEKRSRKDRNRFHSKKAAIKTALGMIRAVTRKIKFGKRVSTVNHGYTSVMNFKVFDNAPQIVIGDKPGGSLPVNEPRPLPENENPPAIVDHNLKQSSTLKDEATQTEPLSLEDKYSQTRVQEEPNLHFCDVANAHLTTQPKTCAMACFPSLACCPKPVINVFPCSGSQQMSPQMGTSHIEKQVPSSDGNLSTQYTLKQICEELLVQLSARREIFADKQTAEHSNNIVRECSAESSTSSPGATISDLKAIVHSLQSIQSNLKNNVVAHQQADPTSITVGRTETLCAPTAVQFKAMSLRSIPEHTTPKSASLPATSTNSSVTPDLLQLAGECTKFGTSTPTEVTLQNTQLFKASPPKMIEQQKGLTHPNKIDLLETINWPTVIPLEENSDRLLQQMLAAGLVTIVHSDDKIVNIPFKANQNANDINKNSTSPSDYKTGNQKHSLPYNKTAHSTDRSLNDSSGTNSLNSSDDFALVMEESSDNMICNGKTSDNSPQMTCPGTNENNASIMNGSKLEGTRTDLRNGCTNELNHDGCEENSNSVSSSKDIDVVGSPKTSDSEMAPLLGSKRSVSKNNSDHLEDLETKVLGKINGSNSQAAEKIDDALFFEEMDASEVENILTVWRQQEQLHQDHHGSEMPPPSSQNFLFKMTKKNCELPPELKNVRVVRPPPLKKEQLAISALQSLNGKANEPVVVEEDDVPEISPSVLPTPKKRRLSLRKNPPSPLPVVFHKSKQLAEDLRLTGENSPTNDNAHSSSAPPDSTQMEEHKESTLSEIDDDTPLSMRIRKRRKAAPNIVQERPVSVTGSSKKQDIARRQTDDEKSSTEKKKSQTRKSNKNVEDPTEKSMKGKTKSAVDPSENSKKGKSKNAEDPNNDIVTENSTKERKKTITYDEIVAMAHDMNNEKKEEFQDQSKERLETLNKKWLQEKNVECPKKDFDLVSQPTLRPLSFTSQLNQGRLVQEKIRMLSEISVYELGKAHDTAINILLNPWRGINARRVTRDYEPPTYDSKCISRSLWDLRSGASPDDIVNRIMSLGWKEVDLFALKSLVSMFVLSLVRTVPFVIEAAKIGEEDDTCSILSDLDLNQKKKATSVRVVATRHIFKGECIDGLNGLFLKPSEKDKGKDRLKTWVFPKFKEGRKFVVLGPLAYLKRKEGNSNTEALILKGDVAIVKATRQILCGERLLVSFERIEKYLGSRVL